MAKGRRVFNNIDEFRKAAQDNTIGDDEPVVRVGFASEIKAGEGDDRTVTWTISTPAVDRMGDTIAVEGWHLDQYRDNPVILWAHDSSSLPVAKATKIWTEPKKLKAEGVWTPAGLVKFNDIVLEMIRGGFLNATSVGFMPLKYAFTEDPARRYGIDFIEQTLLEFSVVPVPANPEALVEGKAAGIDIGPILDWATGVLERGGDVERIVALAEKTLSADKAPNQLLTWAKQIAAGAGMALMSADRVERIERAATAQRIAEARKRRQRDLDVIRLKG